MDFEQKVACKLRLMILFDEIGQGIISQGGAASELIRIDETFDTRFNESHVAEKVDGRVVINERSHIVSSER